MSFFYTNSRQVVHKHNSNENKLIGCQNDNHTGQWPTYNLHCLKPNIPNMRVDFPSRINLSPFLKFRGDE